MVMNKEQGVMLIMSVSNNKHHTGQQTRHMRRATLTVVSVMAKH